MTIEELLSRIVTDPYVCFGKPTIRGHRIWVSLILDFASPIRFSPGEHAGIVVLRPPPKTTPSDLDHLIAVCKAP